MRIKNFFIILFLFVFIFTLIGCNNTDNSNQNNNNLNNNNQNNNFTGDIKLSISIDNSIYYVGDSIIIDIDINNKSLYSDVNLIINGISNYDLINNVIIPYVEGEVKIKAQYNDLVSNEVTLDIQPSIYDSDPYKNMTSKYFYDNYKEAINPKDVIYRTNHGYMSGDLVLPNQEPEISSYQPKEGDKYVKNIYTHYSDSKDTYYIIDSYGETVDMVFKNGGYIGLDEVASYLTAYGDVPANYNSKKSADPSLSIWGAYLRVNNTKFSGSTSKYPYEPELPNISGCGGDLTYYEIDFGTTGTDCDPNYHTEVYNDGYDITRGAARLVYARFNSYGNQITNILEKYVFYTYNHYNDFQEYLNYYGGWGKMFGNITGGGKLSSKHDYNPTPYVEVYTKGFSKIDVKISLSLAVVDINLLKKDEYINL